MAAVYHVGGKRHIYCAVLDVVQFGGYYRKVVRRVDFSAEGVVDVYGDDGALTGYFIEGVFRVALCLLIFAELLYPCKPKVPVVFKQFVERLGGDGVIEKFHADFFHHVVFDDGLKILLRQFDSGGDRHTT